MYIVAPEAAITPPKKIFLDDIRFPSFAKIPLWDRRPLGRPMVVTASDALPLVAIYDSPLKAILHRFYGLNDRQDQERVEIPSIQLRAQIITLGALKKRVAVRGNRYEEAALMPLAALAWVSARVETSPTLKCTGLSPQNALALRLPLHC